MPDTMVFIGWMSLTASHDTYQLCVNIYKCLHGIAPQYFPAFSTHRLQKCRDDDILSVWIIDSCIALTSRFMLTAFRGRSYACAAPSTWNSLPDLFRDTALSIFSETVGKSSSFFLLNTSTSSKQEVIDDSTLYNFPLYYYYYYLMVLLFL